MIYPDEFWQHVGWLFELHAVDDRTLCSQLGIDRMRMREQRLMRGWTRVNNFNVRELENRLIEASMKDYRQREAERLRAKIAARKNAHAALLREALGWKFDVSRKKAKRA